MKTLKISKVLIAIDYDPTAQKVAENGFSIAKSMKAHCILLHVISDMAYYSSAEYSPIMGFDGFLNIWPAQETSIESLKNATMLFLEKSKIHLGDPDIQTMVREGLIAETILKTATEISADVIVLGSHSRNWLKNILMGSVTEAVVQKTTRPLFIIPTRKV